MSVWTGWVTGIPNRLTTLRSGGFGRARTRTPRRVILLRRRMVTSIRPDSSYPIPHRTQVAERHQVSAVEDRRPSSAPEMGEHAGTGAPKGGAADLRDTA
jgi:hypothetical protein